MTNLSVKEARMRWHVCCSWNSPFYCSQDLGEAKEPGRRLESRHRIALLTEATGGLYHAHGPLPAGTQEVQYRATSTLPNPC